MEPLRKIKNPCEIKWESMEITNDCDRKICKVCNRSVFDVTAKNDKEIEELLKLKNHDICVKSYSYQLSESQTKKSLIRELWRKSKFAGIILIASLISQDLAAQQKKKEPDSYHIIQEVVNSDTIIIRGIIKGEKWIGWKKLKNATINLWSEENINLGNIQTERNGRFEFKIERKIIGDNFSISISALDYKRIKIENIKPKETDITIYLEEKKTTFVTGRYF